MIESETKNLFNVLNSLKDFYVEIKWEFESSLIPLVGKIAPSDTFKIWKYKNSIRMDYSIVGYKNLKCKRRNMSLLFNPLKVPFSEELDKLSNTEKSLKLLWMMNNSNKFFSNIFVI